MSLLIAHLYDWAVLSHERDMSVTPQNYRLKKHSTRRKERGCETSLQMEEEKTNHFVEGKFHIENPIDMLENICQT